MSLLPVGEGQDEGAVDGRTRVINGRTLTSILSQWGEEARGTRKNYRTHCALCSQPKSSFAFELSIAEVNPVSGFRIGTPG